MYSFILYNIGILFLNCQNHLLMKRLILTIFEFYTFKDNALKNNITNWEVVSSNPSDDIVVIKVKDCPMLELLGY